MYTEKVVSSYLKLKERRSSALSSGTVLPPTRTGEPSSVPAAQHLHSRTHHRSTIQKKGLEFPKALHQQALPISL